ncbi:hypothetical protein ACLBKU_02530 [Erythrobacter sp. NE805]|uniref:hypothetical protein n=1 Tax=Erythrobacter sp. NE805 TaxID=3389875 RepID=UPI00396B25A5
MAINKDMRGDRRDDGLNNQTPERNRANQQAAEKPAVDAEHGLDDRGHMTAAPHEGSTYQPLRAGSDEQRQQDNSDYVIDQGAASRSGDQHPTSRQRGPTQHGDAIRETQSAPGGGSVFQPLEADPRHLEDPAAKQAGNPAGQNQQGLDHGGPGEQIRPRRAEDDLGTGSYADRRADERAGNYEDERGRRSDEAPRGLPGEHDPRRP